MPKSEPSLTKIILALCAIALVGYGVYVGAQRLSGEPDAGADAASAGDDIARARAHLEAGRAEEARAILEDVIANVDDPAYTPTALAYAADIDAATGRSQEALDKLARAYADYPGSPERWQVALDYAALLEEQGELRRAAEILEEVLASAPPAWRADAKAGLARVAAAQGDNEAAGALYGQALDAAEWGSDAWLEAAGSLGEANVEGLFSRSPSPDSKVYVVQAGDSVSRIGSDLNVTQGSLIRANGLAPPYALNIGDRLKYTPKDFEIFIERSTLRLYLFDKDGLFKWYPVGLGAPGHETTLGVYKISDKEIEPVWHKKGEGPIPYGDPRHELGTRWMKLEPLKEGLPNDLGVHGTNKPETVGTYCSNGCARLTNDDVEELYDLVIKGTPVRVVEKLPGDRIR